MIALIERELRAAVRRKHALQTRGLTALVAVLVTLLFVSTSGGRMRNVSHALFEFLLLLGCGNALVRTAQMSLDLIALERRSQTLGLLMLTGLSSGELFLSKLGAAFLSQVHNGLALLPCFAVCFVLGGVPGNAFLAASAVIMSLTILTLGVSALASTLAHNEDEAMVWACLIGGALSGIGPAVYFAAAWLGFTPLSTGWLQSSPLYGLVLARDMFRAGSPQFWLNTGIALAYSVALLTLAGTILRWTWRQEGNDLGHAVPGWQSVVSHFSRSLTLSKHTDGSSKSERNRSLLDEHPFLWLALWDDRSRILAWIVVNGLAFAWFIGLGLWPQVWASLASGLIVIILMASVTGVLALFSTAKRTADDRSSGALELLLTTPLTEVEIVAGQQRALAAGWKSLRRYLLFLGFVVFTVTVLARPLDSVALAIFVEIWAILALIVIAVRRSQASALVIWAALNCGRPLLALQKTVCPPIALIGSGYFVFTLARTGFAGQFPTGSADEFWVTTVLLVVAAVACFFAGRSDRSTGNLIAKYRRAAQRPLPNRAEFGWGTWDPSKTLRERETLSYVPRSRGAAMLHSPGAALLKIEH